MDKSSILKNIQETVLNYDSDNVISLTTEAIAMGIDPIECLGTLTEAINKIGSDYGLGKLYLPDLIAASDVVKKALPILTKEIEKRGEKAKYLGKILIGTVAGDIHSIGKDIVSTLLFASGFEVIDLGIDVSVNKFIEAVKNNNPQILAMSALLTTTASELKKVILELKNEDLREKIKVIVGGAPINKEFADLIGADGYGATALEGVRLAKELIHIT